jgi:transposase
MSENELIADLQARCDLLERQKEAVERERDTIAAQRDGYADRMAEMLRVAKDAQRKADRLETEVEDLTAQLANAKERLSRELFAKHVSKSEKARAVEPYHKEAQAAVDAGGPHARGDGGSPPSAPGQRGKPKGGRGGCGRAGFPEGFPRVDIHLSEAALEALCSACGAKPVMVGENVYEFVDFERSSIFIARVHAVAVQCAGCGEGAVLVPAEARQFLPGTLVGNGLLAASIADKIIYRLPFYAQSQRLEGAGLSITRANLTNWCHQSGLQLVSLVEMLESEWRSMPSVHMDETTTHVLLEEGRKATDVSWVWLRCGERDGRSVVLYDYDPSRAGAVALRLLEGFSGNLQTDGYAGYQTKAMPADIVTVGCLSHARRRFKMIQNGSVAEMRALLAMEGNVLDLDDEPQVTIGTGDQKSAAAMLSTMGRLWEIERQLRSQLALGEIDRREFLDKRRAMASPVFAKIRKWLDNRIAEGDRLRARRPMYSAVTYLKNQWDPLVRYLDVFEFGPDNSAAERAVVPVALGRKNYGHSTSPEFCVTTMRMYSILVTAMHNGLEPGSYLRHVLDHAPRGDESSSRTREIWQSLLPWNIDKDRLPWNDRSVTDARVSAEAVQT